MDRRLRVLILEDVPADAELELHELEKAGLRFEHRVVARRDEFLLAIEQFAPDIILSDYSLPQFDGLSALALVLDRAPQIPFVMVTGAMTEETAVECMKAGAADYVLKEHLGRLGPAVRGALDNARLERERSQTQRVLFDSEERLRLALAAAQMGVWEWDILTNVVFWSAESLEVLGAHELDATLDSLTRLLHPEDAQRVWDAIIRSHREQSSFAAEFRMVRPDGSVRWMSTLARTAFDPSGTPVRMVGVVEDVTSRRAAEEALRVSEQNYRTLFEEANDAMVVYDPEGEEILDVNARACETYGYSRDELVGTSFKRLTKHVERGEASIQKLLEEGSVRDFESVHLSRDGREINVLINSSLIEYRGRKAVLDIIRDISERRRAEEALRESEARYRQLFASAIDGIAVADAQTGILTDCNETLCSMVGRTREQLIGQSQAILHPPEPLISGVTADFALGRRETPGKIVETKLLASDGSMRDVEIRATLVDRGGRPHMVGVFRDLTERKKLEREVALRQQRLDSFFQGATAGLVLFDEELRFVQVNDTLAEMGGVPAHEHLGRTMREVVPKLAPVVEPFLRRVLTTGEPVLDVELSGETPSQPGVERHWLASVFPIAGPTGKPQGVGSIVAEVTERKHLEAQLRQAQKMEAIGRLAGGVAHDFNNILQAMLSSIALLQLDLRGAGAAAEPLKELDQLVRRAASLTQQLLLFSRRQPAVRALLELKDAVRGVNSLLRRVVRENVAITSELADSPLVVLADRGQLEQVLLNLAVNASDAMPDGGTITLRAGADGGHVFLSVSDTGVGMTEEVRAHLFEPFFTTKAPGKGTGLGLSVVHGIVTAHGGRTEVTSAPGEGATFTVWLPRAETPPEGLADPTKRPGDLPVGGTEHILVVEDEEGVRKSVAGILRSLGYTVTTAASGEVAGARPADPAPDLLLTDVVLPGMTGAVLAERLRDLWPALKVVMMSGYLENEAMRDLAASGRVHFLQKPFDTRALALAIRQTLDEGPPPVGH